MIIFKGALLLGCRRKSDEIEIHAAQKDGLRCHWSRLQSTPRMFVGDESINRCAHPVGVLHFRNQRARDSIERLPAIRREKLPPFLTCWREFRQLF